MELTKKYQTSEVWNALGRFESQKLTSEPQNLQISLSFAKQVSNKIRELGELVLLGSEGNIKVLWAWWYFAYCGSPQLY